MNSLVILSAIVSVALAHPGYLSPAGLGHSYYGPAAPLAHSYHGPPAPLAHDGQVIDTPEVAHAKLAHLATHAEAVAHAQHDAPELQYAHADDFVAHAYKGPLAPLAHDGRVIDTPEVAHAKHAHLAVHAEEAARGLYDAPGAHYDHYAPEVHAYKGPLAPLAHDGQVVDTPEVAHAKLAHLSTHAEEAARSAHLHHW